MKDNHIEGDDNVVLGDRKVRGSRNVIINSPIKVNTSSSVAIGSGAKAGPRSIAIGANAGAGSDGLLLLNELKTIIEKTDNQRAIQSTIDLISELKTPNRDNSKIKQLWGVVKKAATLEGAISLIKRISPYITYLTK